MIPATAAVPRLAGASGKGALSSPLKLMIVDDSAVARAVLSRMIAPNEDLEVVALAANAREALDALDTNRIDIVILDVEMPGETGLDILPQILARGAGAQVLVVSSLCEDGAETTLKALALGAADTLPKPGTGAFGGRFAEVLAARLRRIGPARAQRDSGSAAAGDLMRSLPNGRLACIALGASTGGLHALNEFFALLPARISAPILITQHLPAEFMPFFARQLAAASGRTVRVGETGMPLVAEEIIVAPGDAHLGLRRRGNQVTVELIDAPASSGCMPSVDVMLSALSEVYGKDALGVILSGMGRDGLVGSARLIERGGAILVQDEPSSSVWGMPGAVAEAGLASAALPPAEIAHYVGARASAWT
ncbi:MAG: cheB [Alphaproteobacteria bacterium]|nr:cheB [Alphaproteobacteria bacterium]